MNLSKTCAARAIRFCCRRYSQKPVVEKAQAEKSELSLIRNIGILAHIDAGKTTTTERMLFYSGRIDQMGEVHDGNTVTDFMNQERERGITIASASVTFQWNKHNINLLDTPGHIDFTMEVEQTLNVMDGAIVILDGSAGVEAQTITVWKQANKYSIPRLIYVNKMDKPGAGFFRSLNSVQKHLHVVPLVLQLPILNKSNFEGIVNLLSLEKCEWNAKSLGSSYTQKTLTPEDGKLWEESVKARKELTETLADLDDKMAEIIIIDEKKLETVSSTVLRDSIRKVTLEQKGIPVFCGSSYKNIGVQLLMDGVIDYLPSPICAPSHRLMECFGNNLCARAFKVRHDNYKGPVTFFRIYSGSLTKGQKIYNCKQEKSENCGKLYKAYADDYEEVPKVSAGNIAAVTGLKVLAGTSLPLPSKPADIVMTEKSNQNGLKKEESRSKKNYEVNEKVSMGFTTAGELVTSTPTAFNSAQKALKSSQDIISPGPFIPDPVFFCSVEAPSPRKQGALDKALCELQREDPSLRVTVNNETGQTVLGGMGELHLEIIRERIRGDYDVDIDVGPLQIAYKEALIADTKGSHSVMHKIGNGVHSVNLTMSVLIAKTEEMGKLLLDKSPECVDNISAIFPKHLLAVKDGIESALECGPKVFSPVINVNVMLHMLEVGRGTSETIITSATSQCVKKLLKAGGTRLLEPLMLVEITCNERMIETVIHDLERRKAELESTEARGFDVVIRAFVPLSALLGYSKELRILTSGTANFSMEFHSLREMNSDDEAKAIKSVFGI